MNPELKLKIDQIHSLNIGQDQKMALFGKLMEGEKAKYPPAPPTQPGLVNQPMTQQGFNVADINAARQGGGPLSTTMQDQVQPTFKEKINSLGNVDGQNPVFRKFNPNAPLPEDRKFINTIKNRYSGTTNDSPNVNPGGADLNALKARVGYSGVNDPANTRSISMDEEIRNSVHAPLDGSSPIPTMPNKYNDLSTKPYDGSAINWQHGNVETLGGNQAGTNPTPPGTFDSPPSSMWNDFKEYMFAGKDQKGLFGGTGIDPRTGQDRGSMGLSGAFGRLFDNPNRMAMLSGGLTALDPNSYYDKEGFSSPWTGLRSGLGGAQAGYKSVIDRRKAEAETAKLKAEAGAGGQGKDTTMWRLYQRAIADGGFKGNFQDWYMKKLGREAGTESAIEAALKKGYENTMRQLPDMQIEAEQDVLGLRNLYESKKFLDEGIISGTFANPIAGFHIMLKTRFGIDTGSEAANTRAFAASMGNQVGQIIKQFGAGTGLSDADREYAEKIVGGDPGSLTEASIRELMRIQEKMYRYKIKNYQRKSNPFIKALKEAGGQGMDYSISTEGLDLDSATDWGKKAKGSGKHIDPRRARMGDFWYKRDANGDISSFEKDGKTPKKYRTPQNNPKVVAKPVGNMGWGKKYGY